MVVVVVVDGAADVFKAGETCSCSSRHRQLERHHHLCHKERA
eukprot:CAMPEP_0194747550 /NCGR_PEP_ID=MMETSP0323_2-20130528/1696_1 /TAXON_ID=2866 ORGANISM="Crypthecodinium cohnii, Strain Seligo" /NCGR_SAMPLE_ID=MMETSP0323_2 /ASSEMBLY_ACC=CAM_ASM_000346 /LENGTH=41 /DNA_ID= /DNA_START= /DNA_END= /DNA_ORIENTATION=